MSQNSPDRRCKTYTGRRTESRWTAGLGRPRQIDTDPDRSAGHPDGQSSDRAVQTDCRADGAGLDVAAWRRSFTEFDRPRAAAAAAAAAAARRDNPAPSVSGQRSVGSRGSEADRKDLPDNSSIRELCKTTDTAR